MNDAKYITLTDGSFEQDVLQSDIPVMVDFGAVWCPPCRQIEPAVEEIATEYEGRLKVGKFDVDNNPDIAAKYGIRGIPAILFFKNGEVVDKIVGAVPKSMMVDKIAQITVA